VENPSAGSGSRLASLAPIGAILCLLLLFYSSMVFDGHEPFSADTGASEAYARWADESREQSGRVPLWYPDIYLGMPSYASFIYTPASPMSWIHRAFDLNRGTRYVLWLFIGGTSLFLLLRRRGASVMASLLGALTFVFTPYFLGSISAGHSSKLMALAFAPMVFLAVDYLLDRGSILAVGLAAWAVALQLWANHPQIVFYTWLLLGPYILVWFWKEGRGKRASRFIAIGVALTLAALMVTLPYLPIMDYTSHSTRGAASVLQGQAGSGTQDWGYATMWSFHPVELVSFLFPSFYGLEGASYWGKMPMTQSTHAIGIVPLVFAIMGMWLAKGWRRVFLIAASIALLVIGFGKHVPVLFGPIYHLVPLFDRFRVPSMIYSLLPLVAAMAMVVALDRVAIALKDDEARGRVERFLLIATAGFGAFFVIGLLGLAGLGEGLGDSGWFQSAREKLAGATDPAMRETRHGLLFGDMARSAFLAAAAAGIGWLRLRRRVPTNAFWIVVTLLLVVDLFTIDRAFYNPVPKSRIQRAMGVEPTISREILAGGTPVRVLPLDIGVQSGGIAMTMQETNDYGLAGIQSTGGYHPAGLRRVKDFVLSGVWRNPAVWEAIDIGFVTSPIDAGYVTVPGDLRHVEAPPGLPPGLTEVARISSGRRETILYRHLRSLGRAYMVPRSRVVSDPIARLTALGSHDFAPDREVILDAAVGADAPDTAAWQGHAALVTYADDLIEVDVDGGGGYLVIADAYYPDWRADVDGREAEVHAANHVTRCVAVPPGAHRVTLRFVDDAYGRGRILNGVGRLLALGLIVFGLVLSARRNRRVQGEQSLA